MLDGKNDTNATEYTRFKENIEYTVIMPGDFDQMKGSDTDQCKNFVLISGLLAMLLALSTILVKHNVYIAFLNANKNANLSIHKSFLSRALWCQKYRTSIAKEWMISYRQKATPAGQLFNDQPVAIWMLKLSTNGRGVFCIYLVQ